MSKELTGSEAMAAKRKRYGELDEPFYRQACPATLEGTASRLTLCRQLTCTALDHFSLVQRIAFMLHHCGPSLQQKRGARPVASSMQ